jgi:hypothetical protein
MGGADRHPGDDRDDTVVAKGARKGLDAVGPLERRTGELGGPQIEWWLFGLAQQNAALPRRPIRFRSVGHLTAASVNTG